MDISQFFITCLAVWRVSSLVANEKGPFHIFERIRQAVQRIEQKNKLIASIHLYEGVECEWCNSVWFSFIIVYFAVDNLYNLFVYSLAVSTVVIFMKCILELIARSGRNVKSIRNK